MSAIDLGVVQRTMNAVFEHEARAIQYRDRSTGETLRVSPEAAAAASGLLPAFLVAGEAVWREMTGEGFGLDITHDPDALLGYRVRAIDAGNFATVMLATMEATEQAARHSVIVVNDLNAVWSAAATRHAMSTPRTVATGAGVSP